MKYLIVIAMAAGCTCLNPVDEGDGGAGGGSAGGGMAGGATGGGSSGGASSGDGGCTAPTDCSGTRPNVQFCGVAGGLGWSCIDAKCLWECNGGRTCDVTRSPDGGCLTCATPGTDCRLSMCANNTRTADVESSTCAVWPGTTIPFDRVTISGGNDCRFTGIQAAGVQPLGSFEMLTNSELLADFPTFGGTCTGAGLGSGVQRWVFNCPDCQFVLRF